MASDLSKDSTVSIALKRFKLAADAEKDIREASLEDLKFSKGSDQWPADVRLTRSAPGSQRPCLTINRIPSFTRQVTNDQRMNRPSLKIDATDESTIDTAEIMEGLVRHIQVASDADIAYDTACDSQVNIGFGYFRVITEYCNDKSFDQDIKIKRIKNPFTVYFDPFAIEPDYSDAKWAFIVADISKDDFKASYDGDEDYGDLSFITEGDDRSQWMTGESIRVAEYFEVVETKSKIYQIIDGTITDQRPEDKRLILNQREITQKEIVWRKITALEVLETLPWAGSYIPIIPVLGEDTDIDGERVLKGMVRDAKDPQRMYNYWVSAQTEAIALAPKAPFIIAEGQVEGYEKLWDSSNVRNWPYLVYKPQTINGNLVGAPQRQQAEPAIQAISQAIAQSGDDLKNTTGIYSAGLGQREGDISGRAIQGLQKEGDVGNFQWQDNLARSIKYLGKILLDLIPKIYDAPRVIRILHEDGEAEVVKINQMFDRKGKQQNYDMSIGNYDVVVNVGPSFSTKRKEAADGMLQMLQTNPNLWNTLGDLAVRNLDLPGAQQMADRLKKMLPPQLQDTPGGQPEIPPQVQQQMQQLTQQNQQLTQALNHANELESNKTMELESKERIAASKNETDLIIAAFKAESQATHTLLTNELQAIHSRMALLNASQPIAQEGAGNTAQPPAQQELQQSTV